MSKLKSDLVASMQMLKSSAKYYWKKIDWDVVQILLLVGTIPLMIIIGGIFFRFFTPYYDGGL